MEALEYLTRPLVLSMNVFGLGDVYFMDRGDVYKSKVIIFNKVYSVIVNVILWLNFLRFFAVYTSDDSFGPTLLFKMLIQVWFFKCALNSLIYYRAFFQPDRLIDYYQKWNAFTRHNPSYNGFVRNLKTITILTTIISWIIVLANFAYAIYALLFSDNFDIMTTPIHGEHWTTLMTKVFYLILHLYLSAAWVFPVALYFVIGFALYYHFKEHSEQFKDFVASIPNVHSDTEIHRKRHQLLCHLTYIADECFSAHTGSIIVLDVLLLLIVFYLLIWYETMSEDPYFLTIGIFWIISGVYHMGMVCLCGGIVASKAHAAVKYIHDIDLRTVSSHSATQILMFANKLDGRQIGLSAMGLFVIDKQTIICIIGILLTYFVIIVQFQQAAIGSGLPDVLSCNCTR